MIALLLIAWARADALLPGQLPCTVERCEPGEPASLVVADRDGPPADTGDLVRLGFHKVCDGGGVAQITQVWCGPKGALVAGDVPPSPRCDTATPVASLLGVLLLLGALRRR